MQDLRLRNEALPTIPGYRVEGSDDVAEVDRNHPKHQPDGSLNHIFSDFADAIDTHYSHAGASQTARIDEALGQLDELKDNVAEFFDAMMQRISETVDHLQSAKKSTSSGDRRRARNHRRRHRRSAQHRESPLSSSSSSTRRSPLAEVDVNVVQR